jgi:hypothetical protein
MVRIGEGREERGERREKREKGVGQQLFDREFSQKLS